MELKPGYKQTEVGVIPEEWEARRLGDLASVTAGGTPSRTNSQYWHGDIPWVTTAEVDFCTINQAEQSITKQGLDNSAAKLLSRGTLLMALYGQGKTRGKVGILGIEAATNQACAAISLNHGVFPDFIFHFLSGQYETIRKLSNTGNQENLNGSLVRSISVLTPPFPEQRAIAAALSDVDGLLGGLDRLIAKKRDLKQAAMQQLLTGQTRLPGFDGEWEVKEIGNYIDLLTGFPFPSADYCDAGIRLLRGSNVKRGVTDWSSDLVQCWPMMTPDIARYELHEGDLVIAMDGSLVGRSYARIQTHDLPAMLLQRVARIRSTNLDIGYLTQFVGSDVFISYCDSVKTVTAIPHISPSDIRNFRIPVPPTIAEQTAIAEVLTEMDAELAALAQRREKTRALKQAMMQELLTGRTRLQGSLANLGNGHATAQEAHA